MEIKKHEPVVSPELLQRRADAAGRGNEQDQLAGSVLGCLLLRGHITPEQHEGGSLLTELWSVWSRMAAAPARHARAAGGTMVPSGVSEEAMPVDEIERRARCDADPENPSPGAIAAWERVCENMQAFRVAIRDCRNHALVLAILESVCMDEIMPPRLQDRAWSIGWDALKDGLDVAAEFFGVHGKRQAA
ncbi:hypothetical protein [Azospirillum sp.]|uniref:hypothetical protein n=1 Tax=Azospirillum sp. TaxID=34012 RepID=UPI003D758D01